MKNGFKQKLRNKIHKFTEELEFEVRSKLPVNLLRLKSIQIAKLKI